MKSLASTQLGLGLACLATLAHAPIAVADDAAVERSGTIALEEVIVTARKREENLSDIPLSISATSSEEIERLGVRDIADIAQLDPALNFKQGFSPGDTRITIRGLAPTRGRPNVATLVDGIDISSEAVGIGGGSLLATPRLLDVERVEVVKGPQSALFGRSAFGGAVQYVTKDPASEFEASISGSLNDDGEQDASLSVSFPFGEKLGVRLNGAWWDDEGTYRNQITGNKVGGGKGLGGALTVKFEPTDALSFKFRGEYTDDEFDVPAQADIAFNTSIALPADASTCRSTGAALPPGSVGGPLADPRCVGSTAQIFQTLSGNTTLFNDMQMPAFVGAIPDARQLQVRMTPNYLLDPTGRTDGVGSQRDLYRLSLVADWNFAGGTVSWLTGYTDARQSSDFDTDKAALAGSALGADLSPVDNRLITWSDTEQFSQELRFVSDFDGPFNFVVGAHYWKEELRQFDRNLNVIASGWACSYFDPPGPAPAAGSCNFSSIPVGQFVDDIAAQRITTFVDREVDHQSAYLQLTFAPTEKWRFSAEARYSEEDNSVTGGDPVEIAGGLGFYNEQSSGSGIVVLCGSTGSCTRVPNNPVRGFSPVGSTVVSPLPAVCTPPFVNVPGPCLPAGFQLPNPGTIYRTYDRTDKFTTPRFTLEYKPAPGQLVYLSYAVGEKPGGITTLFSGSGLTSDRGLFEFEPEKLKEYELGAKFTIDDIVGVNLAFFKEDFTDKQVQTQVPIGNLILTRTTNASSATVDGIEISVNARFTPRFTVNAAYQFLDGRYEDYLIASGGASEIARVGNCTPTVLVAGQPPTCLVDRSGRKLEEAPEHTLSLNARYRAPLGSNGLNWFIEGDVRHETERFIDDANTFKVDDHTRANLRFGLEGEKWGAILFVDNVTDDDSPLSGGTGPGTVTAVFRTATLVAPGQPVAFRGVFAPRFPTSYFANMPDPRQIGLRVRYKF